MQLRLGGEKKKHRAVLTRKKETVPTVSAKGFKSVNKSLLGSVVPAGGD